jgi:tetratricopeptide (TPR) repeat protein
MKLKPIYIYATVFIITIIFLFVISDSGSNKNLNNVDITNKEMPKDDIHQNLNKSMQQSPNSSNVTSEFKTKLEGMKKNVDDNPNDTLKIREYADFLTAAHKSDEALKYYELILSIDKNRKDILFSITYIHYSNGNLNKAEEVTKNILQLFPNDPMADYNLGAINATRGNKVKAREIWTKLIKDFPNTETAILAQNSLKKL